jgi:hypothetical protein
MQERWVEAGGVGLRITAKVIPSSMILFALMTEAIRSSDMPVLTRATRRYIWEDGILHSYSRENFKSYVYSVFTEFRSGSAVGKYLDRVYRFPMSAVHVLLVRYRTHTAGKHKHIIHHSSQRNTNNFPYVP